MKKGTKLTPVQKWQRAMKAKQLAKANLYSVMDACAEASDEEKHWIVRKDEVSVAFEEYRNAHLKLKEVERLMNEGCKEVPICEPR